MNYEVIFILTGIMLFSYWFNYIIGGPLSDDEKKIDTQAILFKFPRVLAIRRLKKIGLYEEIRSSHWDSLSIVRDKTTRRKLIYDYRLDVFLAGREFFTWERSLLCPICLHWWLTLIVGFFLVLFNLAHAREDFLFAAFVYLANHLLIRKIS